MNKIFSAVNSKILLIFFKKTLLFVLLCFCLSLSACQNNKKSDEPTARSITKTREYDLFVFNSDSSIEENFEKMCNEYTQRTGVVVKAVTLHNDENLDETLDKLMNSENFPNVFSINNISELRKWQSKSKVWDFSNATEDDFKNFANEIPTNLRLSSSTIDSYGLPCDIEGFGLLVDPQMLSSLFGGEHFRPILSDLKTCSYDEFESMVNAVKFRILNNEIYEFKLGDRTYSPILKTEGLARELKGVFSFPGSSLDESGYILNTAFGMIFNNAAEANISPAEKIEVLFSRPLARFAEALDLISSSTVARSGFIQKGAEMIDANANSKAGAIKNFAKGQTLFLPAKNTDYETLATYNSTLARRVVFIPIKIPISEGDLFASNMNTKRFNSSISIYCTRYFCINADSTDKEKKLAQDFLTWYETSEIAEKYKIENFRYVPWSIKNATVIDNPISRSMIEYLSGGNFFPNIVDGAPEGFLQKSLETLRTQYLTKTAWNFADYEKISELMINIWKNFKS